MICPIDLFTRGTITRGNRGPRCYSLDSGLVDNRSDTDTGNCPVTDYTVSAHWCASVRGRITYLLISAELLI